MRFHSWSEEKRDHVLKTDGDKLFKDLLTNKILSNRAQQIASMVKSVYAMCTQKGFCMHKITCM